MIHLTVQSRVHLRIRALKDALSDLQIDVKKVVAFKGTFEVAFKGALEVALEGCI